MANRRGRNCAFRAWRLQRDQPTGLAIIDLDTEAVGRAGELIASGFADRAGHPFAGDSIFHYCNVQLPDLAADYHGSEMANGLRQVNRSLTPLGEEPLVAVLTKSLSFGGMEIDVDAIPVWRIVGGQIHEAWNSPAVNTGRRHVAGGPNDEATATSAVR